MTDNLFSPVAALRRAARCWAFSLPLGPGGLLGSEHPAGECGRRSRRSAVGEVGWSVGVGWAEVGDATTGAGARKRGNSRLSGSSSSRGMAIAQEAENGTRNPTSPGAKPLDLKSNLACGSLTPPVLAQLVPAALRGCASNCAPAPLALFTCPLELGRHASPGSCSGARARCRRGTPTGSTPPRSSSHRRESRGTSLLLDPSDRP